MKKDFFYTFLLICILPILSSCIVLDARSVRTAATEEEQQRIALLSSIAPPHLSAQERAEILVSKMTLDEKISLMAGYKNFYIAPIDRLGLRPVRSADASMGLRSIGRATGMPSTIGLAASFDTDLAYQYGKVIAQECRAKGIDILLGPGVNIYRVPTNSRNFEYMGEDPFLAGKIAASFAKSIQDEKLISVVKHFACNNSEYDRNRMNSIVDERTLHEIYFPAFKRVLQEGGAKGVMMSYNPVNGVTASENDYLMNETLRKRWGFDGVIMSDWISVYNTAEPYNAGLNLDMPHSKHTKPEAVKKALQEGTLSEATIDQSVKWVLRALFASGIYDRAPLDSSFLEFGGWHDELALKAAKESIVLLKNEKQLLPLNPQAVKKIVVIGPNAEKTPTTGGGSAHVRPHCPISILDGLKAVFPNTDVSDSSAVSDLKTADAVIVCIGFDWWHEQESHERPWRLPQCQIRLIKRVARYNPNVIVNITSGGGIETESWIGDAKAVLHSFYGGQSVGAAVADVVVGNQNPSAKLPMTMAKKWEDFSTTAVDRYVPESKIFWSIYPLLNLRIPLFGDKGLRRIWDCEYKEGVMVGYRHFITNKVEPQFEFGFGLSYTTFSIDKASLSATSIAANKEGISVKVIVSNKGALPGAEVVQVYVRDKDASVVRPDRELKGFKKVFLEAGESKEIEIPLEPAAFAFFDIKTKKWKVESGEFQILVGNSSMNIAKSLPLIVR